MTTMTTTAATGTTTTEPAPAHRDARPLRSGVSVRVRITATVAALVLVALGAAGTIVYVIESQRLERQTAEAVDQELDEFGVLTDEGIDPGTGEPFESLQALQRLFMQRNVPDDDELLLGFNESRMLVFPDDPLAEDTAFLAEVRPLVSTGGSRRLDTPQGEVLVTSQPITQGSDTGALMVVVYLAEDRAELHDTMRTYATVAGLSLLLVTAAAFWQSGRLLAPLRTLRDTAEEIGETDLSRRIPTSGNDDITALTHTVNGMLDRLEHAFTGQRQFLDDAGHELKTPLTVLRGHLELLDTGSPAEVEETKALLLDEVDRMSRLVGDLILLAKSDRPDFVTLTDVELAPLTEDTFAKARALGDRDWQLDAAADATIQADAQRIAQALLQLADNAVKHTAPGDTIALGSSYDDGVARLWVRDTGPGVPAADRTKIFERFGRSAVPDGDEGFGLGLSIVSAIVDAHDGTVTVEDADPPGARFVIALPARPTSGTTTLTFRPLQDRPTPEENPWPAS
ncbi:MULTISPECIES: sensor histidine kinase [unclassified Nocardioides]|uniref:sensor histidine kinase n=1 Tax=unclassified Nocardioides TaxID=2615069 RepID=UPI003014CC45